MDERDVGSEDGYGLRLAVASYASTRGLDGWIRSSPDDSYRYGHVISFER